MSEFATRLRAQQKRKLFESLLESGIAALHLDPRAPGVAIPSHLRDQPVLVLNYSFRYGVRDFRFDDRGVEASLSFSRQPFLTVVPWAAVFAVTNDARTQGSVWQEDLPVELSGGEQAGSPPDEDAPSQPPPKAKRAKAPKKSDKSPLLASKTADVAPKSRAEVEETSSPAPLQTDEPKRPGLRLIDGGHTPPSSVSAPTAPGEEPPSDPPPRPAGGHLRRIK